MEKVQKKQPPQPAAAQRGRPRAGTYRLETTLPQQVLDELKREEADTGVYRTRVAANILCNWAKNQRSAR